MLSCLSRSRLLGVSRFSRISSCSSRLAHACSIVTLAIETSCDDTSVAILESPGPRVGNHGDRKTLLHFHDKITSNNKTFGGIHPIVSLESHQETLAELVSNAVQHMPPNHDGIRKPDFVSVTRGPGMRANLFTGLDTAKGLAVAWNIPLVGVHHMQAHALTPRLVAALEGRPLPQFPFMSILVSGGHTILLHSTSLADHKILATTADIALGDCLDKIARAVLPSTILEQSNGTMYGALLERFAFPLGPKDYNYSAPTEIRGLLKRQATSYGWAISPPFANSAGGLKALNMEFSFTGIATAAEQLVHPKSGPVTKGTEPGVEERRVIARETMRVCFEHLAIRIILALQGSTLCSGDIRAVDSLVVSGGVAANGYLRHILSQILSVFGYDKMRLLCPPQELCTDNAAMIAWTGLEMFHTGYTTPLGIRALRKWPLDMLLNPPVGN